MELVYRPQDVRPAFRRKFCRTLSMPSGKWSNVDIFPITEEEINKLTNENFFGLPDKIGKEIWATTSEWQLWAALRLKYGINYLTPRSKSLSWAMSPPDRDELALLPQINDDNDDKEIRLMNMVEQLVDFKVETHEKFHHKEEKEEKEEKSYRNFLTDDNFDVIF